MRAITASLISIIATIALLYAISHLISSHSKQSHRIVDRPQLTLINDPESQNRQHSSLSDPEQLRKKDRIKPSPAIPQPHTSTFKMSPEIQNLSMAAPAFDKNLEVAPPDISGAPTSNTEDQALTPLIRIPPIYPRRAAIKGIEGWVELEFTVLESGSVTDVKILKAKPKRIFNRAAINAISAWKFKPRITDGKPVKQRATQIITFQLSQ